MRLLFTCTRSFRNHAWLIFTYVFYARITDDMRFGVHGRAGGARVHALGSQQCRGRIHRASDGRTRTRRRCAGPYLHGACFKPWSMRAYSHTRLVEMSVVHGFGRFKRRVRASRAGWWSPATICTTAPEWQKNASPQSPVRLHLYSSNARLENIPKYQSCMVLVLFVPPKLAAAP